MSPNPVVLLMGAVNVKKWFAPKRAPIEKSRGGFEHRDEPVPGFYEYCPGRGLYLVALDSEYGAKLDHPILVIYSKLLHRDMLDPEYKSRQKAGSIIDDNGKKRIGTFFRMDDGFTWTYWRDQFGNFDTSPRRRKYCIDSDTGKFRPMTAGDCIIDGQGVSIASSSIRMAVSGDVHKSSSVSSSLPSSTPGTRPSTRPSSKRGSSADVALRQATTQSSVSTPPSLLPTPSPKFDGAELNQRLRALNET